ncbi:flagellar hook-length control protein FliK [Marinagarivorans algicola]|uniref:flagellar hook-length control protein FliK n=1 Tax=Marinagarivorans algicola TaxID=1513270 RepID=UPI003735FCDE
MRSESPSSLDIPSSKSTIKQAHKARQIVDRSTQEAPREKPFKASFDESSAKAKGQAISHKVSDAEKSPQSHELEHKQILIADDESGLLSEAALSVVASHIDQAIDVSANEQGLILVSQEIALTPSVGMSGAMLEGNAFGDDALKLLPSDTNGDNFGGGALLGRFEFNVKHEKALKASTLQMSTDEINKTGMMTGGLPVVEVKYSSTSVLAQSNDTLDARGASAKLSQAMAAITATGRESANVTVKGPEVDLGSAMPSDKSIAQLAMNSAGKLAASHGQGEAVLTHQKINFQLNNMLGRSVSESTIIDASAQEILTEADAHLDIKSVSTLAIERTEPKTLASGAEKVTLTAQMRVGMPGWADQIAERTASLVSQNIKQAEIQLNPQEMGPINIKISVNQDQVAVIFSAQNAGVREALDQGVQRLRDTLESEGMALIQADVDDQQAAPDQDSQNHDEHTPIVADEISDDIDTQTIEIALPPSGIDQFA